MEPHGLGALQLAFEQLKKKLQAEGLFDAARKRALPALPRKIGVVTSLDGAAVRDILKVLSRRYPNAHIVIRPSRVQGEDAAADLAGGLALMGRVPGVDVVIIGRGGGSGGGFGLAGSEFTTFRLGFDASWELDLFGRNRREREAAAARTGAGSDKASTTSSTTSTRPDVVMP